LWRHKETGEWWSTKPLDEENYPYGKYNEFGRRHQPLWQGFDYYYELDAIRVPHKTQSLERCQRGVNQKAFGKPYEGKFSGAEVEGELEGAVSRSDIRHSRGLDRVEIL
jgi:hypothetical protein